MSGAGAIRVVVGPEHVRRGRRRDRARCPVAIAVREATGADHAWVGDLTVWAWREDYYRAWWLSGEVIDWIETYDGTGTAPVPLQIDLTASHAIVVAEGNGR